MDKLESHGIEHLGQIYNICQIFEPRHKKTNRAVQPQMIASCLKFRRIALSIGLYTWSDLHTCANFAYMQNLHTYANRSMCTHLLTYAKFARMQKLKNWHLPQTKCKSHFAYMQILHICKSGHVNGKQNLHT